MSPAQRVIAMAAAIGEVGPGAITGPSRKAALVELRAGIALVLAERGLSYPIIVRLLGRTDHTTARHLRVKAETLLERAQRGDARFAGFAELVDALRAASRAADAGRGCEVPVAAATVARLMRAPVPAADERGEERPDEAEHRRRMALASAALLTALAGSNYNVVIGSGSGA